MRFHYTSVYLIKSSITFSSFPTPEREVHRATVINYHALFIHRDEIYSRSSTRVGLSSTLLRLIYRAVRSTDVYTLPRKNVTVFTKQNVTVFTQANCDGVYPCKLWRCFPKQIVTVFTQENCDGVYQAKMWRCLPNGKYDGVSPSKIWRYLSKQNATVLTQANCDGIYRSKMWRITWNYYYYYWKRSALQGWERVIYTLSVQRPQPRNTNL